MNHIQKLLPLVLLLAGCASYPEGAERGPSGTIAHYVRIESEHPGRKIEIDGEYVGVTPCTVKVWGDLDGTFHKFNSRHWDVVAHPSPQMGGIIDRKKYRTAGTEFSGEDRIPKAIYFPTSVGSQNPALNVYVR
jgi:hypothetical protein